VVNVGAGTGSYEPADREVTAVEPSQAMIDQRPPGSAPCVRAAAEALPFGDGSFDAALAVMTVHHWDDLDRGLAELARVARDRIVILTWDPGVAAESWLTAEYLPELRELDVFRFASPATLAERLGGAEVIPVPIPADCRDGFIEAFWARPEAYLDPTVRQGMSGMRAMDPVVVERAMARLAADLAGGDWDRRHGDLRERAEMELGYRLLLAVRD
jgi:SAM-dependent methyltransferase